MGEGICSKESFIFRNLRYKACESIFSHFVILHIILGKTSLTYESKPIHILGILMQHRLNKTFNLRNL